MKKIIFFLLTLAYITATSGATVYLHECMGKVIDWNIRDTGDKCANCGMHKNKANDCCKDIVKSYKLQSAHSIPVSDFHGFSFDIASPEYFSHDVKIFCNYSSSIPFYVSPPPRAGAGLCIFNCTFLI